MCEANAGAGIDRYGRAAALDCRPDLQRKQGNRAMSDAAFAPAHIKVALAFALSTVNHMGRLAADTCCQEVGLANPAAAAKDSPA